MTDGRIKSLESAVDGLIEQLKLRENCEKSNKWLIRGIWTLCVSVAGLIFTGVFFLGGLSKTVDSLEKNEIDSEVWETYQKKTNDTYNMVFFKKDTRFTMRGGSQNNDI